ncbi:MAG: hypothetical protein V1750_11345, partial [Acidobacteriota bacterium]
MAPQGRDLPTYFVPLRQRTAEILRGRHSFFWNPDSGCGEPYFANPQTGLLYPPAWLALVLPAPLAVGVETGLHLALLGAGCALLASQLGARGWLAVAAGWGVALAGPAADAACALNNLDTLAWLPWLWLAALSGSLPGTAGLLALAYLAGEPQLAALGAAVAFSLAPRRRVAAGLVLAAGLVAVQLLPFAAWVQGGDRGRESASAEAAAGAILPIELAAMVAPGMPLPPRAGRFVAHLAIPVWGLVFAAAALGSRGAGRRLAAWGWGLAGFAVLAGTPPGQELWRLVTAGLLRYPGRLLFVALAAWLPAAAAAASGRPRGHWRFGAGLALA